MNLMSNQGLIVTYKKGEDYLKVYDYLDGKTRDVHISKISNKKRKKLLRMLGHNLVISMLL